MPSPTWRGFKASSSSLLFASVDSLWECNLFSELIHFFHGIHNSYVLEKDAKEGFILFEFVAGC